MDEDTDSLTCGVCARRTRPDADGSCPYCRGTMICSWCTEPFTGSDMRAVMRVDTDAGLVTVEVHMPACRDDILALQRIRQEGRDTPAVPDSGDAQPEPPPLAPAVSEFLQSLGLL